MNGTDQTALEIATSPSAAMAMTYVAAATSIGMAMSNAVAAQQRGQVIGETATIQVVAQIIAKRSSRLMSEGTVNSQIVDSVANVVTLASATALPAFAMLDAVFAEALGMAMHNAVNRQQSASMIGSAAVTAACARMLGGPLGPIPRRPCRPNHRRLLRLRAYSRSLRSVM
jgi:hypothetical protein